MLVAATLDGYTYYLSEGGSSGQKNVGVTVTVTQTGRPTQTAVSQYSSSDMYNGYYFVNGLAAGPAEVVLTQSGCDTVSVSITLNPVSNHHDFQICK
jgi:hypothetical protein